MVNGIDLTGSLGELNEKEVEELWYFYNGNRNKESK